MRNNIKVIKLIFLTLVFISCTKGEIKVNFEDLDIQNADNTDLVIASISSKESKDLYEYSIRIPKILLNNEENESLKEFNTEINDYVNDIVNNLDNVSNESDSKGKKALLNIDYKIYHGYNIYSIILILTQNINDNPITNYRSYYIREDGKYLYNIDDIIDTDSAFPFFISKIKNSVNDSLLFDLQQAIIYFENKNIVIKFPEYVLSLDDNQKEQTGFEFKEEEVSKYIKNEYKEAK